MDALRDRPRQPHIACYQRAWLTLLDRDRPAISARAVQLSGRRMRIVMEEPAALSAPVSIETGDWMALGEVCYCNSEYSHYVVELELDQMLIGLREIIAREQDWQSQVGRPPSFVVHVPQQPLA